MTNDPPKLPQDTLFVEEAAAEVAATSKPNNRAKPAAQVTRPRSRPTYHANKPAAADNPAAAKPAAAKPAAKPAPAPHYHGHRQRLRERFSASNGEGFADYELLEMLLFRAIPRRDCKPIAKNLLAKFGSLAKVLTASTDELTSIENVTANVAADLRLIHRVAASMSKEEVAKPGQPLNDVDKLVKYCRVTMGHQPREHLRALFLDVRNRLIRDDLLSVGTIRQAAVYPREIIKRALDLHASSIIMVHNHPSGDCKPSTADVVITNQICDVAYKLGIELHDHIIVSDRSHFSMRDSGVVRFPDTKK